jgi:hypothetical protein
MADEKKTRKAPVSKVVHVFEVLDESGQPMAITKAQINTIVATRNTETILDMMEAGDHPNAVFVRAPLS